MTKPLKVAVVGATGLVGVELLDALGARRFPVESIRLFSSMGTAGERLAFQDDEILVEPMAADFAVGRDLVFFAAHPLISRDLVEEAVKAGAVVIDSSRTFRAEPGVPLVVPEVNAEALAGAREGRKIVASPSAAAVALALVVAPLHRRFGVRRVVAVTAYGSTALGRAALQEHQQQTIGLFNQEEMNCERFSRQSAFNLFPRVGDFVDEETEVERDLESELPRIVQAEIGVAATAVQSPYFCGIGSSVNVEFGVEVSADDARAELGKAAGVRVMDVPAGDEFPDTVEAMNVSEVLVGRIRKDPSRKTAIQLWISADNLRKGSALNMVQIAEELFQTAKP